MGEIKQVFEGSCNILIPIKAIAKQCCDLVDSYVPELVEMLASEMNPDIICTVAGLCNSRKVDKMITEYKSSGVSQWKKSVAEPKESVKEPKKSQCKECKKFLQKSHSNLKETPNSIIIEHMFVMCGDLGAKADGCRLAVISNFY